MSAWDDDTAQNYADSYGDDPSIFEVLAAAMIEDGSDVIDIGCGSGPALAAMARTAGRLAGVDPTPRMIEIARARCPEADLRVAPGEATGFDGMSFDVVTIINVIHHFDDIGAGLAEAYRLLRPGGRVVIGGEVFGTDMLPEGQDYSGGLEAAGFSGVTHRDLSGAFLVTARKEE
ncbi:MAG: class I SAM-dependent methyltransferase [Pseudomonadota bacterium]|nr:class I SAM-dependent methyltransferase [Pseudomonadota bacterium]